MRFALLAIISILAFLVAPIVEREMPESALRPDVLLVPIVAGVAWCPGPAAVVCSGAIGLGCDCLADSRPGPRLAAFALLAAVGSLALPKRPRSLAAIFVFCFALALTAAAVSSAITISMAHQPLAWRSVCENSLGTALSTAILLTAPRIAASVVWRFAVCGPARAIFGSGQRRPEWS